MPCALEVRGARIQNRVPPHAIFVGCVYFDKTSAFHEGEQVVVYVDDTFVLDDLGAVVRPAKVTSFDGARKVFSPYIFLTRQKGYDMTEETKGLPVAGYKPTQPKWALDIVNENKHVEERVLRQIEKHHGVRVSEGIDQRMVALAKTKVQEAFMWLNRAVFQPGRVELPEDNQSTEPAGYKDRVRQEREELDARLEKLEAFIDSDKIEELDERERTLLVRQFNSMCDYLRVLDARIASF